MRTSSFNLSFKGKLCFICLVLITTSKNLLLAETALSKTGKDLSSVQGQQTRVTGSVTDSKGEPLIGVSVRVKGATTATSTNVQGIYSITVPGNSYLVFSYIGFSTKEVQVNNRSRLDVVLVENAQSLEEIVVVGYGVQKKANLTGSVSTVNFAEQAESRPITNISSALSGLAPGLQALQGSGEPGSDGATLRIRGTGTLNNASPLVLVDGFQNSMDNVNPNDIESVTVLKDAASASIYGSLAANGVILITTKKGKANASSISYNGFTTLQSPVNTLSFVSDYAQHMEYINEGKTNMNRNPQFSQSSIDEARAARLDPNGLNENGVPNYMAFPNTNWFDEVFDTGVSQQHNLSFSGGKENINYLLSVGYLDNNGIVENSGLKRTQFRANVEAKPLKWLTVGTRVAWLRQNTGLGNVARAFEYLPQTTPGIYPGTPNKWGYPYLSGQESSSANNVFEKLNDRNGEDIMSRGNFALYSILNITKGLTFESNFNYAPEWGDYRTHANERGFWNYQTDERFSSSDLDVGNIYYSSFKRSRFITDQLLRFNTKIATNHELSALLGYNQTYYNEESFDATKTGMLDWDLYTLGTGLTLNSINGSEQDYAMQSVFSRVNYAFKSRYLFEANLRYDGSSRFSPDSRWGLFPSFSVGWRLTDEPFMKGVEEYVQDVKLRASWGKLGNAASGYYDWQATYNKTNTVIDGSPSTGLIINKQGNSRLKWETTTATNLGLEFGLFKSRLLAEIDVYNKQTSGILFAPELYLTSGTVSPATENIAGVRNRGIELNLSWKGRIGDFGYQAAGNFSYNKNLVTKYKGTLQKSWTTDADGNEVYINNIGQISVGGFGGLIAEGHTMGETNLRRVYTGNSSYTGSGLPDISAGPKDGMIRTENDLKWVQAMMAAGYTFQPLNAVAKDRIWYGDLIYADSDGDGNYGDADDMDFTGKSSIPKYNFGFNLALSYKSFDLSTVWFGSAGFSLYWKQQGYNSPSIRNGWSISQEYANNAYRWNPQEPNLPNANQNGSMPRFLDETEGNNGASSTFWEYDGSFLKLRNLQIGYTVPQRLTKKLLINRLRIYASGENLLTFTNFPGIDPEIGANVEYPTLKQYAFGVNLSF